MKESDIVRKIKDRLTEKLPGAVIFKLQDYMTTGIPDICVNYRGKTIWIEVKLLKSEETRSSFEAHFDKLQLATCRLLSQQVPCFYFVAYADGTRAAIFEPKRLNDLLEKLDYPINGFYIHSTINDRLDETLNFLVGYFNEQD